MKDKPLHALSAIDGRYAEATSPLRDYFSEFAFLHNRVRLELDFLAALSKSGVIRPLSESEKNDFQNIADTFNDADAEAIQTFERETRHDVKAIEYYLRTKLPAEFLPWLHFGLTSEDVNNIAQALALRDARDQVLLPALETLLAALKDFAIRYRALPMLARTHGQPAVPTTLGKEFAVYYSRIKEVYKIMKEHVFEAKLNGAVGNSNALHSALPRIGWLQFSTDFVAQHKLKPNLFTSQILPYDNWVRYFDSMRLLNSILIDFAQDIWRYISDGYLRQAVIAGEVGSSTMPQKVNPIDFENAEGNLGVANALLIHYAQKLTVSRLQRDLSDSTVRRTFGTALGHTFLAWKNLAAGMGRIAADEERIRADLDAHWEVVSEGTQTILRAAGKIDAYESLRSQTRGRVLTESDYRSWCDALDIGEEIRTQLKSLTPESYIGLAVELVDKFIS